METLVATVLIVIIFMLSSMILNNLFYNSICNNTAKIESYYHEFYYFYSHNKIKVPYYTHYKGWSISINDKKERSGLLEFNAFKKETGQQYRKQIDAD